MYRWGHADKEGIKVKTQLFLIEFEGGARMTKRLPCDKKGGMTSKAEKELWRETRKSIRRVFSLENTLTRFPESAARSSEIFDLLIEYSG